jgi:hypothetical protein
MARESSRETVVCVQQPKKNWLSRACNLAIPPTFWQYQYGDDVPNRPDCRALPAGKLLAVDTGEVVRMRARDGSLEFDALELFGFSLCFELNDVLGHWAPRAPHVPRVTIGDLTISRERWETTPAEIALPDGHDRAAWFLAVRRWASARGLPRYVFYKSPREPKPCYLDFDSPVYVNLFAKAMTQLDPQTPVRVVEMLPGIEDTWLVDADGTTYTSELRFVARAARGPQTP